LQWRERSVYLFDLKTGTMKKRITGMMDAVTGIAYSRDGKYLAVLQPFRNGLLLFRTSDYTVVGEDSHYAGAMNTGVDFSPVDTPGGRHRFVTTSYDGLIRLYEITPDKDSASLNLLEKVRTHGGKGAHSARFSPDGTLIAVGFRASPKIDVYSSKDLSYLYSPDTSGIEDGDLRAVAWSPDGEHLYGGGYSGRNQKRYGIRKWSKKGKGPHSDIPAGESAVMDLITLNNGDVVSVQNNGTFGIFGRDDRSLLSQSTALAEFGTITVSHDGTDVGFKFDHRDHGQSMFSLKDRTLMTRSHKGKGTGLQKPLHLSSGKKALRKCAGLQGHERECNKTEY
jgi:WD40 repeat protein